MKALLVMTLVQVVTAQAPTETNMNTCYSNTAAKRWCVAADAPAPKNGEIPNGWCCDDASTDEKCTNGDSYKCTLNNKGQMAKQLWSTYWPGITPQRCGGDSYS